MNICLMFVHEPIDNNRQNNQKETDQMIINKLGSNNVFTNFITYDDPIIISFMIILLTLMIKLNVKEIVLYSVIYDITYHIIEYFYVKLYNLK